MKTNQLLAPLIVAPFLSICALAQVTIVDSTYSVSATYTHTTSDDIVSFDWTASGQLYYATSTASYNFGGLYAYGGGTTTNPVAGNSLFSGGSVVAIGDYVYFNASDFTNQYIYKFGPLSGSSAATQISTTYNSGLYGHDGSLFITGAAGFGTNQIYHSDLTANGNLVSNPATSLGVTSGGSGPLAFDAAGDLYYAPGFGDLSIYMWSAAEVASALADPAGHLLSVTGHLWVNYSSAYGSVSGATSMLVDGNGDLLVTLTDFSNPSPLVKFDANTSGAYAGTNEEILNDSERLGELRSYEGGIFVSSGNQILQVVPEPSTLVLAATALGLLVARRNRR